MMDGGRWGIVATGILQVKLTKFLEETRLHEQDGKTKNIFFATVGESHGIIGFRMALPDRCRERALPATRSCVRSTEMTFALDAISPRILLCFDFDGTMHHPASTPPIADEFWDLLNRLRDDRSAVWGINTGRSLPHLIEGLEESQVPYLPDFIVAREREIFYPDTNGGWHADRDWNDACHQAIADLLGESKDLMGKIRFLVEERTGAEWLEQVGEPAGIISRTEEEMAWIVGQVESMVPATSRLGWQRNTIYLRFGHRAYQKGSSLARVTSHFGLKPSEVFAIGDSHNDIEMLHHETAAMIACPANAVEEIAAHVARQGGYLCRAPYSQGAAEAMRHFLMRQE
ncbi:MAG: hypothetical protein RI957_2300 [Verrucomicrobiota bacterium]|jgi:hydroxymethylpyrimidine pyrophosphatase-like HAD family hydrolase